MKTFENTKLITNFQVEELENRLEFKGWATPDEVSVEVGYDNNGPNATVGVVYNF